MSAMKSDREAQLLSALADPDPTARYHAAEELGNIGAQKAGPLLIKSLRDDHELVRGCSAKALGQLRHEPAVPQLIACATDPSGFVSHWAAWALGEIGTPEATDVLLRDDISIQGPWLYFIRTAERRALPRMRAFLRENFAVQEEAQWALGSGEPSLVKAALDWAKRERVKLRPKRNAVRWGQGNDTATMPQASDETAQAEQLKRLNDSGWLDEVPPREAKRIKAALAQDDAHGVPLSPAGYDAECIENSGDYKKWILSAYRKASFGAFNPTDVKDRIDHDNEVATVSFKLGRKAFSRQFPQPDDYVADAFHGFINKAVAATGEKKRFQTIEAGQIVALVFVTPKTFARARRLGLI